MARRLVEAGVTLVQVNLGNNETWDTHGNAFPHLKDKLLPADRPRRLGAARRSDRSGLLDSTLIVMAGEFGRTPQISTLPSAYKLPGRDHWGAVQSVFFAGGGVAEAASSAPPTATAAIPPPTRRRRRTSPRRSIARLAFLAVAEWHDELDRPHAVYHGDPIPGLT